MLKELGAARLAKRPKAAEIPRFASRGLKAKRFGVSQRTTSVWFFCVLEIVPILFSGNFVALMIGNTAFALMIALMIRAIGALDGCYDGRTASIITL